MTSDQYDRGGYLPLAASFVRVHPDKCIVSRSPLRCIRQDHPTPTSDCADHDCTVTAKERTT